MKVYVDKAPDSLLRSDGKGSDMRAKFEKMIRKAQDEICGAIERADGAFCVCAGQIPALIWISLHPRHKECIGTARRFAALCVVGRATATVGPCRAASRPGGPRRLPRKSVLQHPATVSFSVLDLLPPPDAFVLTPDEPSYGPHTAGTKFREDTWTRPGGGGGISRVLAGGNVRSRPTHPGEIGSGPTAAHGPVPRAGRARPASVARIRALWGSMTLVRPLPAEALAFLL